MKVRSWIMMGALTLSAQPLMAQGVGEVGLPIGSQPQAVTIEDLDGNAYDLAQFIGTKPLLLEFWATWCELCAALMPELEAAHAEYGDRVQFVAVSVAVSQSKRSIGRHLERHPVPFPVVWDTRGRATREFQAPTTSYVVILDGSGAVVYTGVGGEQDIRGALATLTP
jgi:thiol-disulfide isomerase/thioredoxin